MMGQRSAHKEKKNFSDRQQKAKTGPLYQFPTMTIHDQLQIEISSYIPEHVLHSAHQSIFEMYFFVPTHMGVNEENLREEEFFELCQEKFRFYLRGVSPLNKQFDEWKKFIHHLLSKLQTSVGFDQTLALAKGLAQHLNSQIKLLQKLWESEWKDDPFDKKLFKQSIIPILKTIRSFRERFLLGANELTKKELRQIALVDEFMSHALERFFVFFLEADLAITRDDQVWLEKKCLEILRAEKTWKSQSKYPDFSLINDGEDKEKLLLRLSWLKKYIYEDLYLNFQFLPQRRHLENIIAMIGAALAAFWAVMLEIQRFSIIRNPDYNIQYVPLIAFGVIAYVFKDRIKELTRMYLGNFFKRLFPDRKATLEFGPASDKKEKQLISKMKQTFGFKAPKDLPSSIMKTRRKSKDLPGKKLFIPESIACFSSHFQLKDLPTVMRSHYWLGGIKQVFRFDLTPFMRRLDDPLKMLKFYDEDSGAEEEYFPRIYHLNCLLVQRFQTKKVDIQEQVAHFRIVLNKQGPQRVEEILGRRPNEH